VYDYAFWNDAGSFRSTHEYKGWPDPARVQELWKEGSALSGENSEDLLFFPIAGMPHPSMRYWVQDHGPVDAEVSEGARFCELFLSFPFISSSRRLVFRRFSEYRRLVAAHVLRLPRPLP
jgi:hypothetical protein